ncbi:hypothetical protein M885DRAFT_513036 [Pelagophyceae sp. CCMP2097]|nr:hypothetical protein M885DRAFT_513036 [Pelagophyceae sp. CCMP2097]
MVLKAIAVNLAPQEEKDVRRVFEFLAGMAARIRNGSLPQKLTQKRREFDDCASATDTVKSAVSDVEVSAESEVAATERTVQEKWALSVEIKAIEKEISSGISTEEAEHINARDLEFALRQLGRACNKKQIEYMIWEVDENLDGVIDWEEFQAMYQRNTTDESGLEPFELFNIVQFMTYLPSLRLDKDFKDFKAAITEDDTMSTLFARYGHDARFGRVHVEKMMGKLFGDKLKAQKGEGVLSLDEYLGVVGVRNYARKRAWWM